MTKAAFASGLDTKGHCDVQDWSPHIWEKSESRFHIWEVWGLPGLSSPEGYHERIDQLFVWFCSFAMSVFPMLPWFVSTLCLNYLVFFCDLMCLCFKFSSVFSFLCVCIFDYMHMWCLPAMFCRGDVKNNVPRWWEIIIVLLLPNLVFFLLTLLV